ncbi:hypothetical protein O152_gp054 [Pseudomonas phage PaBG]|uniref:hypothetical protein n=1 Tax=Pseudomonas phage PaBG TaxID=1335230 RepID=UPI00155EFC59|nr:hypothetical protein O152_gp054 [Pseudomonas phage PaBG]QKE11204.1 hypothetical protein PaBG_00054 [Pseudomonas phage PaBG]
MSHSDLPLREDLRKFGYAPGGYMIVCRVGDHPAIDCDKRASCCLECAEKLLAKETEHDSVNTSLENQAR